MVVDLRVIQDWLAWGFLVIGIDFVSSGFKASACFHVLHSKLFNCILLIKSLRLCVIYVDSIACEYQLSNFAGSFPSIQSLPSACCGEVDCWGRGLSCSGRHTDSAVHSASYCQLPPAYARAQLAPSGRESLQAGSTLYLCMALHVLRGLSPVA